MKVLYLDINLDYMAPTRNLIPVLLKHEFDVVFYGPGYVDAITLSGGIERFVDANGPFDFVMTNEHIVKNGQKTSIRLRQSLATYKRNYVSWFDLGCVPDAVLDIYAYFMKTDVDKIIFMLETDYYCLQDREIDVIESMGGHLFTEGIQFVKSIDQLLHLSKERFASSATDSWHRFVARRREKIISVSQFVGENEFAFHDIRNRKNLVDIPGMNYWARRTAHNCLKSHGLHLPSKKYQKCYSLLTHLGVSPYSNYPSMKLYNAFFRSNIESSKYVYTCGSGLEYPIRKFYEIPALGAVMVCMPCAGFGALGFKDGENAVVAAPDQLKDVIDELERDQRRAADIAAKGRELIWQLHTARARGAQLRSACAAIKRGDFHGAYWDDGQFKMYDAA